MLKTNNVVQKTKEHFKKNKKQYILGSTCFAAGSILTYFTARPSIGTLNVYHAHINGKDVSGMDLGGVSTSSN